MTHDIPLVSIVTPAYNQAAFLRETIESVLSQDYPRIEYLVLDDGSTDATPEILREYSGRIQWERHANAGQTPTINRGWARSQGSIVTWLNSDDTLLPGAVSTAVAHLQRNPGTDIVFGDTLFTAEDGSPIRRSRNLGAFDYVKFVTDWTNVIPQPSAFIRRSVVDAVGMLDPYYDYFMDWDYWLRAGIRHRITYVHELLSTYRLHPTSKTIARTAQSAPELQYMFDKYFQRDDLPEAVLARKARARSRMHLCAGTYYADGGDRDRAIREGRKAIRACLPAVLRPASLHQLLFCFLGGSRVYRGSREIYRRARSAVTRA